MVVKKWTPKQDALLLGLYKNTSMAQLSKQTSHTPAALKKRLIFLKAQELSSVSGIKTGEILKAIGVETRSKRLPGGRHYYKDVPFRSVWEAQMAQIFDYLNLDWQYEPRAFYMDTATGPKIYTPDFYITDPQNGPSWIEVKGRVYSGTYTKLKLFRDQYPEDFSILKGIPRKGTDADRLFAKLKIPIYGYYSSLLNEYSFIFKENMK